MRDQYDLSILIVSWNVRDYLNRCLESIRRSLAAADLTAEVLVIDSGSHDGTPDMVRNLHPWARLLAQTENVGFTRGNNIGLAAAAGRHLLLLNPDTEIVGDALAQMARYLDDNPAVGVVGPRTLNTDGSLQPTRRRFPTLMTGFFESTWLQPIAPRSVLAHYYAWDIPDEATADVDWVQGSALMLRRAVYEQIGGLDEQYIMFSEELDWCRRARAAGWRVVYLGAAQIVHHGGKSTDQAVAARHIHFQRSKLRYFRTYHGPLAATALRLFLIVSYGYQLVLEALKGLAGHKRPMRFERARVYWQVIRALMGSERVLARS